MKPRVDDTVPRAAPLRRIGFGPEQEEPDTDRCGAWKLAVMTSYTAVIVATAVVLAVAGRLA
jgi:hypothetical protein